MLVAASQQLRAMRGTQHAARTTVEAHVAAYEAAQRAYAVAQRQETDLRALLRTAEARTAQLRRDLDVSEHHLRAAATELSRSQLLCHALEARIAEHVKCQQSAVLLSASSRLCCVDPYSLLHTPTGDSFTYDLVIDALEPRDGDGAASDALYCGVSTDNDGEDGADEETGADQDEVDGGVSCGAEAAHLPASPTLARMLRDAVRAVLHGYHHTLLCTAAAAPHHWLPLSSSPTWCQPGQLCLCVLRALQREALHHGTRALRITLAVGSLGGSAAPSTPPPRTSAAAACGWTDHLLPIAVRRGQPTITVAATPLDGDAAAAPMVPTGAAASAAAASTAWTPTLEGVAVSSLEEAAVWLREAGVLPTHSTPAPPHSATLVLLVRVSSRDAAGRLHESLLRIVSDNSFSLSSCERAVDTPVCAPTSTFALYMQHAMHAVARAAVAAAGDRGGVAAARASAVVEAWQRVEVAPLTAGDIRAAVRGISEQCPAKAYTSAATASTACGRGDSLAPGHVAEAWLLWAALLRPVFGGGSMAVWLHHASDGTTDDDDDDDTAALRLCALFCRLVRHDAVASVMSLDLVRMARGPPCAPAQQPQHR
ncbi:hypothetical protein NESM_000556400 [Novymonas esmeraldas]|uniref:Uncharacterized protein n=1 Tax=Novymonas esmeraldas TaxID=1808958 RepID=A0AAW0EST0_9TRYP